MHVHLALEMSAGGDYIREDSVLHSSVDQIFLTENMTNKFIQVIENTKPSDSYISNQYIRAGYFMFDVMVLEKLRVVAGARYENSSQYLNTINLKREPLSIENNYNDILPSVNLTYILNDNINLRQHITLPLQGHNSGKQLHSATLILLITLLLRVIPISKEH